MALEARRVTGAIVIGILAVTVAAVALGQQAFGGVFSLPPSLAPTLLQLDIRGARPFYDKAYARTVTEPANMISEFMPAVEATLASAEKLAAYLEAHKDQITFSGSTMQVNDAKVLAEANVLVEQMKSKSEEIMAAQRKMNAMISGS